MVKFYFRRVKEGRCTIDEVPARYREEVKQMLIDDGYEFED